MAGNYSRNKGQKAERDLATWLRANGYPNARRLLAGDGRQCGDIDGLNCCIEVKAGRTLKLRPWMNQLAQEQGALDGYLVWREPGKPDPASWSVWFSDSKGALRRSTVQGVFGHGSLS